MAGHHLKQGGMQPHRKGIQSRELSTWIVVLNASGRKSPHQPAAKRHEEGLGEPSAKKIKVSIKGGKHACHPPQTWVRRAGLGDDQAGAESHDMTGRENKGAAVRNPDENTTPLRSLTTQPDNSRVQTSEAILSQRQ